MYRPPKFVTDFISEFADLLGSVVLRYDRILILCDFNFHVCCEDGSLVKDFLALMNSFNLTQFVSDPTHTKGHTLDLVLSRGLDICITDIKDFGISDHFPVLFNTVINNVDLYSDGSLRQTRSMSSQSLAHFTAAFLDSPLSDVNGIADLSAEELANLLNTTCADILNSVAPLRTKSAKLLRQPWRNDPTGALRRGCRRAERKWKKDKLHVSLDMLRKCLSRYQKSVKAAKSASFSGIIWSNCHNPRALFSICNSSINPCPFTCRDASPVLRDNFFKYFTDKM